MKENPGMLVNRDDVASMAKTVIRCYSLTSENELMILAVIYEALGGCKIHTIEPKESIPPLRIEKTEGYILLSDTDLSVRTHNAIRLHDEEVFGKDYYDITLQDVAQKTRKELMSLRNLGRKSYIEIIEVLQKNNIPYNKN